MGLKTPCGQQKEVQEAQKAKQTEVEEAQKKIAEIMVEAQAQVWSLCLVFHLSCLIALQQGCCSAQASTGLECADGQGGQAGKGGEGEDSSFRTPVG